jgi:hypothetical protein
MSNQSEYTSVKKADLEQMKRICEAMLKVIRE